MADHGGTGLKPQAYLVELLFDRPPPVRDPAVIAALKRELKNADVSENGDTLLVLHQGAPQTYGNVPPQTVFMPGSAPVDTQTLAPVLGQTRGWRGAREAVGRVTHQLLVTDLMAWGLERKQRLDVFLRTLAAYVRQTRPIAIHWVPANKLVDPQALLEAVADPDPTERLAIVLNVRLFRVGDSGDVVMDSCGLAPFLLPDLQVHARGLDPGALAQHLYNCAAYLWDAGDVIADGETIEGLDPRQRWRCRHEASIVGPERIALDLDPGPPFAAGKRG